MNRQKIYFSENRDKLFRKKRSWLGATTCRVDGMQLGELEGV